MHFIEYYKNGKIVSKIITSYIGDPYYSISPNPVMQRAILRGDLEVENWSILTLAHRLQAAAMGLPFYPTNSIAGSSEDATPGTRTSYIESIKLYSTLYMVEKYAK